MPPRERRELDASVTIDGITHLIEIDETQHFNIYRKQTFEHYPQSWDVGFDKRLWIQYCDAKKKLEGGGFGKPKPPLFPGEHGRHKQRAFRDALADILPKTAGWGATIRLAYFELGSWLHDPDSATQIKSILLKRLHSQR